MRQQQHQQAAATTNSGNKSKNVLALLEYIVASRKGGMTAVGALVETPTNSDSNKH